MLDPSTQDDVKASQKSCYELYLPVVRLTCELESVLRGRWVANQWGTPTGSLGLVPGSCIVLVGLGRRWVCRVRRLVLGSAEIVLGGVLETADTMRSHSEGWEEDVSWSKRPQTRDARCALRRLTPHPTPWPCLCTKCGTCYEKSAPPTAFIVCKLLTVEAYYQRQVVVKPNVCWNIFHTLLIRG